MAGPRDLNRTFSPRATCNEFLRRLSSSVVASVEKSLSESARLRRNFYRSIRFYYADKVIGIRTIRFENLYLYLRERVAFYYSIVQSCNITEFYSLNLFSTLS